MSKELWIHDYEVYKNLVLFGYQSIKTGEVQIFELSDWKNNTRSHKKFVATRVSGLVGFNNLAYDSYLLDYHLKTKVKNPLRYYELSQTIINRGGYNTSPIIPQLDLYKLAHFDRFKIGLKYCELGMNSPNIADLPYPFDQVLSHSQAKEVNKYLYNDLSETKRLFHLFEDRVYLRQVIKREYGLNCTNWSDTKIGEKLLFTKYCEYTGKDYDQVSKLRTRRDSILLGDAIHDNIKFTTKYLKDFLKRLKKTKIVGTKGSFKEVLTIGGLDYDIGTGGIHAARRGIFSSNDEFMIRDADAASFYPKMMVEYNIYPEHLGPEFIEVLNNEFIIPRNTIYKPKSKDKTLHWKERKLAGAFSDGLKLSGNSIYGLSNSVFSPAYDPLATMKTTLGGQLFLLMLIERLEEVPDLIVLSANTDGIMTYYPREHDQNVLAIMAQWEKDTKMVLEHEFYDSIYQADVNSYIWHKEGYTKLKGRYEIDKKVGSTPALNKDSSMRIVPLAVSKYFIDGIPIEETISNHDNIYDFCIGKKANKGWFFSVQNNPNSNAIKLRNIKTLRYYASTKGSIIYKNHEDGRRNFLEAYPKSKATRGMYWKLRLFNKFKDKKDYEIDYTYYVRKAQKLIDTIEKTRGLPKEKEV